MASNTINAAARLDRLPISGFHRKILLLIGAGTFFDSFDVYLGGSVIAATLKEGWSTIDQNALFLSATFFGMAIGAWMAGVVGDRIGRRASFQVNLLIFGLASFAAAAAPSMEWLTVFRFIMGLGLGAEIVVATGTLTEFIPPIHRGRYIALLSMMVNSGLFASTFISLLVIPNFGWRWMFVIAGVGAIAIWAMRKNMPESPRWLEAVGRTEEAERVIGTIEAEVGRGQPLSPVVAGAAPVPKVIPPLSILFSKAVLPRTLTAIATNVIIVTAVYSLVAWLPSFFVQQGNTVSRSLAYTTLMSIGSTGGAVVGFFITDWLGRRKSLIGFSFLTMLLAVAYASVTEPVAMTGVGFLLVTSIYTLVTIGVMGYVAELFPTEYRLRGAGLAGTAGRVATIITPFIVSALLKAFGLPGVLGFVILLLIVLVIVLATIGIETSNKSLEEVEPEAGEGAPALHPQTQA